MDLFDQVSEDIKTAMKAKDKVALETLRNIKKVFLEAKTAPGANDTLTDDAALKIMQKLMKQGKDAAEIYIQQGRQDLADDELAQVKVIEVYLPKQMSAEELEAALKEIIAETGATSGKDMGKVMGVASKKLKDRHGCYTFSASGLSYDSKGGALLQLDIHSVHRLHHPVVGEEVGVHIFYLKNVFPCIHLIPPFVLCLVNLSASDPARP